MNTPHMKAEGQNGETRERPADVTRGADSALVVPHGFRPERSDPRYVSYCEP